MPKTWWGKTIEWVYIGGYFLYLGAAGVSAWPHMTFSEWQYYMLFQAFYAIIWPIILLWPWAN
jgi:hypothetical protein